MDKFKRFYIRSVIGILTVTSLAKIYSAGGTAKVLDLPDDLLPMTIRESLWFGAMIEMFIIAGLIRWKRDHVKLMSISWLGGNFIMYRVAAMFLTAGRPCPCLGSITEKLPLSRATIDHILNWVVLYLVLGSLLLLVVPRLRRAGSAAIESDHAPIVGQSSQI